MSHDLDEIRQDDWRNRYETSAADLYEYIGRIMSMWADIDGVFFELFRYALGVEHNKASFLFYRYSSISEHLNVTDGLIKLSYSPEIYTQWREAFSEINKAIPFRNQLAHNIVEVDIVNESETGPARVSHYSTENQNKILKKQRFRASTKEMQAHIDSIFPTFIILCQLLADLDRKKGKVPEYI